LVVVHEDPRTPRERRHDQNLQRIGDAALRMVESGGLEALSMNQLAEAVDYTPGALYRYFASKDALLSSLVARVLGEIREHLAEVLARLPPRAAPLARVLVLIRAYAGFAERRPERYGLVAVTLADPRVLLRQADDAAPVVRAVMAAMQPLAGALAEAAAEGQLAPGDVAERTVTSFALAQGLLQMRKQARHAPAVLDIERLLTQGLRALLVGWGAKPRSVDAALARAAELADLTNPGEAA
jgi:AcrR family transcriptional regulator